jgi:hypothetical protein
MTKLNRGHYGNKVIMKDTDSLVYFTKGTAFDIATKKMIKTTKHPSKRYFIPSAIEYGHAFPGKGGKKGGLKDVPAKPFARPAYEANREATTKRTLDLLWIKLKEAVKSKGTG